MLYIYIKLLTCIVPMNLEALSLANSVVTIVSWYTWVSPVGAKV